MWPALQSDGNRKYVGNFDILTKQMKMSLVNQFRKAHSYEPKLERMEMLTLHCC